MWTDPANADCKVKYEGQNDKKARRICWSLGC